jgi:hypothetical protein
MMRQLIGGKKFGRYLIAGCYPMAIDGTQKFTRAECWDEQCLERKVRSKKDEDKDQEPEKQYYVYVLEANLAFQNGMVIPLLSEVLSHSEGDNQRNKQDCEQKPSSDWRNGSRNASRTCRSWSCWTGCIPMVRSWSYAARTTGTS